MLKQAKVFLLSLAILCQACVLAFPGQKVRVTGKELQGKYSSVAEQVAIYAPMDIEESDTDDSPEKNLKFEYFTTCKLQHTAGYSLVWRLSHFKPLPVENRHALHCVFRI
jgi:hypothetical protein